MSASFPIPQAPTSTQTELELDVATPEPARLDAGPRADELLEGLNEPQRAAVVHAGAPLLVVAGAGSGQDPGADPPDRLADLRAQRPPRLDPGDHLHQQGRRRDARARRGAGRSPGPDHVGLDLPLGLRADPAQGDRPFRLQVVVLDLRRRRLQAADDAGLQGARPRPEALSRRARCSTGSPTRRTSWSTTRTPPEDAQNNLEETYAEAYSLYQQRLRAANALDFDDLIMTTVHLFQAFPEVREVYRRRFRHVLVDEYQDTNHAQYALVRELCAHDVGRPARRDRRPGRPRRRRRSSRRS